MNASETSVASPYSGTAARARKKLSDLGMVRRVVRARSPFGASLWTITHQTGLTRGEARFLLEELRNRGQIVLRGFRYVDPNVKGRSRARAPRDDTDSSVGSTIVAGCLGIVVVLVVVVVGLGWLVLSFLGSVGDGGGGSTCYADCFDMDGDGRTYSDIDGDGDGYYEPPP